MTLLLLLNVKHHIGFAHIYYKHYVTSCCRLVQADENITTAIISIIIILVKKKIKCNFNLSLHSSLLHCQALTICCVKGTSSIWNYDIKTLPKKLLFVFQGAIKLCMVSSYLIPAEFFFFFFFVARKCKPMVYHLCRWVTKQVTGFIYLQYWNLENCHNSRQDEMQWTEHYK